jgi:hypothetical protein
MSVKRRFGAVECEADRKSEVPAGVFALTLDDVLAAADSLMIESESQDNDRGLPHDVLQETPREQAGRAARASCHQTRRQPFDAIPASRNFYTRRSEIEL